MSGWWEEPYHGGPMVVVPGFPRELHVGDEDGEDVLAYKRTVSRAGRWPWQRFDNTFSKSFSTGKGPNVIDTGVAGVQRQQNMEDDGVIDQRLFNTLRSIVVPYELPHGGEMAMDVTAANLLALAWQRFQKPIPPPTPPPPPPTSLTAAQARLAEAVTHIGYVENPAGSNHTKFGQWYGIDFQPWCAMFVSYCDQHGKPTTSFHQGLHYSYVPYLVEDARMRRNGLMFANRPEPGDLVCYDWGRDGVFDHMGIFEKWTGRSPSTFTAIEGNTSTSSDSNGGEVMRRLRDSRGQNTVFVSVREP